MKSFSGLIAIGAMAALLGCSDDDSTGDGGLDVRDNTDVTDTNDTSETSTACPASVDPDGDGIPTSAEGGTTLDTDADTIPNYLDTDSDGDTIQDSVEADHANCDAAPHDADGDGTADFLEIDADGNGINDAAESPTADTDADTVLDRAEPDDDNDGMPDSAEIGGNPAAPIDFDGDTTPDYHDNDSDGDTLEDRYERGLGAGDTDGDTLPDYHDLDSDGDTIDDAVEGRGDADEDGQSNFRDLDSDNDGLIDAEEAGLGCAGAALDEDIDGDTIDDLSEFVLGTDACNPGSVPPADTFYFRLPYEDPAGPQTGEFDFETTLIMADVFFLIDTTNSMAGEIENLRSGLLGTVVPGILTRIPDVALGVARYEDFPVAPYGAPGNMLYVLEQQMTSDAMRVFEALMGLTVLLGGDIPEAGVPALYAAATGDPVGFYSAPFISDPTTPGTGTIGGAGFRADSQPIIVMVTDAAFHNDYGGNDPYAIPPLMADTPNVNYAMALAGLLDIGARVIGVASPGGREDLEDIATDTGTVHADGTPIVFDVGADGSGLTTGLVDAIQELASGTPQDVDTFLEDDTSDTVDATRFIQAVTPVSAVPADGYDSMDTSSFYGVIPGTVVRFRVTAFNSFIEEGRVSQVFRCKIVVRGNGVARLDDHDVIILVPAEGAGPPIG